MLRQLIEPAQTYADLYDGFRWDLPPLSNIAYEICDRHAEDPDCLALIHDVGEEVKYYSFREIQLLANRFANALTSLGLSRGDRLMVYLPQHPVTAIAHVAAWKMGLITIPTSILFGVDGLEYRLNNAQVSALVTDSQNMSKILEVRSQAPSLKHIFVIDGPAPAGTHAFDEVIGRSSDQFETLMLPLDTPAMINYTSGTTGWPKGTLQGHRIAFGHAPGLEVLFDFFPQEGDRMWSPADWAWLGGIGNTLIGGWFHGVPLLVFPMAGFDPELTLRMMGRHKIRNAFLTPTMFKLLRPFGHLVEQYGVRLRSIISGSEAVGADLLHSMLEIFKASINEGFGQTEANVVMGNCQRLDHSRIGSIGTALPGHEVAIIDDDGNLLPPNEIGHLAIRSPDPVMMLEYWNDPEATAKKFIGDWMITGDLAHMDQDGFYWFQGRGDDVITSSGYRIGPAEIEDAILRHPAVKLTAVIGVPDPERTEIIRAYIVLSEGFEGTEALADEIRRSVRDRLAKHEYPRQLRFVSSLPMTTTGKILRRELREEAKAELAAKS
ncbi:AMP-binding protein [Sphingopyxis granuli]|uniref:AMP-binding protein n=1 Tax=Sphingopyxis granuli TaxID=267128 RepID=UPI001F53BB84|nr:AMP-binding protein [Sphingopyxis granuli]UNK81054.1 AMP-binding protein [Sphingopyxis granuli]